MDDTIERLAYYCGVCHEGLKSIDESVRHSKSAHVNLDEIVFWNQTHTAPLIIVVTSEHKAVLWQ